MGTLNISEIKNAKLLALAKEVDNSKVSKNDGNIDDKEFSVFKQRAKTELLDKKLVNSEDYTSIFGLEKQTETTSEKVNTDSLAYANAQNKMAKQDSITQVKQKEVQIKNKKISQLQNDIARMRKELYKGKYNQNEERGKIGERQEGAILAGMALGLVVGGVIIAGVVKVYNKIDQKIHEKEDEQFLRQCEKQNPDLYKALKYAEKQLAELQKTN